MYKTFFAVCSKYLIGIRTHDAISAVVLCACIQCSRVLVRTGEPVILLDVKSMAQVDPGISLVSGFKYSSVIHGVNNLAAARCKDEIMVISMAVVARRPASRITNGRPAGATIGASRNIQASGE